MSDNETFLASHPDFTDREFRQCYFYDQFRMSAAMNLRTLREARGLTQERVADAAGITQSMVARAEDPDAGMAIETLIKVFDALGLVPRLSFQPYSMGAAFDIEAMQANAGSVR